MVQFSDKDLLLQNPATIGTDRAQSDNHRFTKCHHINWYFYNIAGKLTQLAEFYFINFSRK